MVGIDASRNRSGGAVAHLTGILTEGDPTQYGIREVHVWTYRKLLASLPDRPWLVKHGPKELERKLAHQLWWQAARLSREVKAAGCHVLFTTDASTLCRFKPMAVMSQDMLEYEPGAMRSFGVSRARLRLLSLLIVQNLAMKNAAGVIFLSRYAAQLIKTKARLHNQIKIIPHGVDPAFKEQAPSRFIGMGDNAIKALYVSHTSMYKHQWVVVQAIAELRKRGHQISITLVGGGSGKALKLLLQEIEKSDPERRFVNTMPFVPHEALPQLFAQADLFIFASSCENLPVTLLEAMAAGLPIACSNRGPMPEVLQDGGVYFDPESAGTIADAVEKIIRDDTLRRGIAKRAHELSLPYSWSKCADQTWNFLKDIALMKGN